MFALHLLYEVGPKTFQSYTSGQCCVFFIFVKGKHFPSSKSTGFCTLRRPGYAWVNRGEPRPAISEKVPAMGFEPGPAVQSINHFATRVIVYVLIYEEIRYHSVYYLSHVRIGLLFLFRLHRVVYKFINWSDSIGHVFPC